MIAHVHVLLNLLNELEQKIGCKALPSILSVFPNNFNKFYYIGTRTQDSIYHDTKNFILFTIFATKRQDSAISKGDVMDIITLSFAVYPGNLHN